MALDVPDPIGFLHRTAAERLASGKRPVKVINAEALQMISDDEEDDADFELASDRSSDDEDGQDDEDNDDSSSSDDDTGSNCTGIVLNGTVDVDGDATTSGACKVDEQLSIDDLGKPMCQICMGTDVSVSPMLQCLKCAVAVHEMCYKDDDFLDEFPLKDLHTSWFCHSCLGSAQLAGSSGPTSRDQQMQFPSCELCPATGGLYRLVHCSNAGPPIWVHHLCSLYMPGASTSSLAGIARRRYGARPCTLCTDRMTARTGVAVKCDAGMCREFMHVTCAQRAGLLPAETLGGHMGQAGKPKKPDSIANGVLKNHKTHHYLDDLYFLTCRQHTDKDTVKSRKKMATRLWAINDLAASSITIDDVSREVNPLVKSKLAAMKVKFKKYVKNLAKTNDDEPKTSTSDQDDARYLHTSAGFLRRMADRQKLNAIDLEPKDTPTSDILRHPIPRSDLARAFNNGQKPMLEWSRELVRTEIVGRHALPPAFSPPFVWYFQEREVLQERLTARQTELERRIQTLKDKQTETSKSLAAAEVQYGCVKSIFTEDVKRGLTLVSILELLEDGASTADGKSIVSKLFRHGIVDIRKASAPASSDHRKSQSSGSAVIDAANLKPLEILVKREPDDSGTSQSVNRKRRLSHGSASASPFSPKSKSAALIMAHSPTAAVSLQKCGQCLSMKDQHLLAACDTCKKSYHLACLEPPLDRMPKRTSNYGWECSFCFMASSSSEDDPDVDAPRQLRAQIRPTCRFSDEHETLSTLKKKRRYRKKQKTSL